MRVLVIIPAFNEARTIAQVLRSVCSTAPRFDRLVVNDGSTDATGTVVDRLGEKQLKLLCRLGYGPALQAGLKYADRLRYDVVAFFDADGQHEAEALPRLTNALLEGDADVAIGSRFGDGRPYSGPWGRRLGQLLFSHLARLFLGRRIYDTTSGLKVMRAAAYRTLIKGSFMDFHSEALVKWNTMGFSVIEVPVSVRKREHGESMHSLRSVLEYPTKMVLLTAAAALDALLRRILP